MILDTDEHIKEHCRDIELSTDLLKELGYAWYCVDGDESVFKYRHPYYDTVFIRGYTYSRPCAAGPDSCVYYLTCVNYKCQVRTLADIDLCIRYLKSENRRIGYDTR